MPCEEIIAFLRLLITTCECVLPNNPDPNLNLELNNDLELNNNPNPNLNLDLNNDLDPNFNPDLTNTMHDAPTLINPDNFSPSEGFENLLIPERRFQDTALFKEITKGNLSELIKSRESAKPVITPGYFSKDINVEKVFSTLYGFKKI